MIDFLRSYWKVIIAILLVLFDLVLLFLSRRKPLKVYNSVHENILSILPSLIQSAEKSYLSGHGNEKLSMVVELVHNFLVSYYGFSMKEALKYDGFIKDHVESILATPTKKEDL